MISWFKKYYFQLLIKFLVLFKPSVLFDRINNLTWYKNMLHQWVDDKNLTTASNVLEVGCATGTLTRYIAKSGHFPTGVDYSTEMIKRARGNNVGINFSVASVLDLPFDDNYFDAVIAASLINIVSDRNKAMSELYRTCTVGGVVTILVPSAEFSDKDFYTLQDSLNCSGFSSSALEAWFKLAPKMDINDISNLFQQTGLINMTMRKYLQGMVISVTGIKPLPL